MPCTPFKIGNVSGIICGGRQKRKPCDSCGRPSSRQCDYPTAKGTCDRNLCEHCARPAEALGSNVDFCQAHWGLYEKNGRKLAL